MTERKLCCKSHRKRILAGQLQAGRDYSKSTKKITKTIYKESKKKNQRWRNLLYPHKNFYTSVYSSIAQKSPKAETIKNAHQLIARHLKAVLTWHGYNLAIKRNEILTRAVRGMNLKSFMLSEMQSQNTTYTIPFTWIFPSRQIHKDRT